MRRLGGAVAAAAVLLMLTACGSQAAQPTSTPTVTVVETPSSTPSPTSASAASSPATSASSTPASSAGGGSSDPGKPADQCTDIGVNIVVADGGGGAGSEEFNILFTNTGGSSCQLRGTPGVSVVGDGNGTQLGEPADRLQGDVTTLRLAVGQTVAAPLKIVNIRNGGGPIGSACKVEKGDGYRVYPPHSTKAIFVQSTTAYACTSSSTFMTVSPVIRFTD